MLKVYANFPNINIQESKRKYKDTIMMSVYLIKSTNKVLLKTKVLINWQSSMLLDLGFDSIFVL